MHKRYATLLLLLPLLLIGCQNTQPKNQLPAQQQWQLRQQDLKQITAFQANGTLAYFSHNGRNYVRFLINQRASDDYQIKLTSPIGTTLLSLTSVADRVELIDKDGKQYVDNNVENLMKRLSNVNIPLNSLHSWLIGLSEDSNQDKLDNAGRLASTTFMQNDNKWDLKILSYMTRNYQNKKIDLPATIELTHDDERVRLKIENWLIRD